MSCSCEWLCETTGERTSDMVGGGETQPAGDIERLAGPHQLAGQAREEPLQGPAAALQQAVRVPALRQPLAGGRRLGEAVSLQERDAVEVVGQDPGRQHPGQAAADDHGVTATRDGEVTRSVAMMSRAHTILLIP